MLGRDSSRHSSTSRSILSHTASRLDCILLEWKGGRTGELEEGERASLMAFTIKGQMGLYAQSEFASCHMYVPAIEGQGFFFPS